MEIVQIGPLAILAAAITGLAFSIVYYAVLSKTRLAAARLGHDERRGLGPVRPYLVAGVAQLTMAAVLAWFLAHAVGGPAEPQALDWFVGLRIGFLAWLGFAITSLAVNHAFGGSRRTLTAIDGLHWLGVLLIQGLVLALIGA
ncbi:MAG: DUF1761 domain-containing protein [Tistlia sp.]|uniref:DUF1761 domain-containing protein n=1 Tax=Tistlia sp. TaxID=3057121 RepID=UPI0034A3DE85